MTDSMGIPTQFEHPQFLDAVNRLVSACKKHKKPAGFLAGNAKIAKQWQERGFQMLCLGTDISLLKDILSKEISESKF